MRVIKAVTNVILAKRSLVDQLDLRFIKELTLAKDLLSVILAKRAILDQIIF